MSHLASGYPLVSVVTPVYNTADHFAECIESVLAQTYPNWEYIIADNRSNDGTPEIAQRYVGKDERIRYLRFEEFLDQVPNYNRALRQISPESRFTKVIQADDWMFPECLERMVAQAMLDPKIGVVGCYLLRGRQVGAQALAYEESVIGGAEAIRRHLLTGRSPFGSPSSVLYRSDLLREREHFYDENSIVDDTLACYELLRESSFGFVHQVLVYVRVDNPSITSGIESYNPYLLHERILLQHFGREYCGEREFESRRAELKQRYEDYLAMEAFSGREAEFWEYHRRGLKEMGEDLKVRRRWGLWWRGLAAHLLNPLQSLRRLWARWRGRPARS